MRIAIAVHGRFHGFSLATALLALGHDVTLFTNYPRMVAKWFGVPADRTRSYVLHGILSRLADAVDARTGAFSHEHVLSPMFGRWVARAAARNGYDALHIFSGVALETLRLPPRRGQLRTIVRGSTHIEHQYRVLTLEQQRAGRPIERPSAWIRKREAAEYRLAERIVVLSRFCKRTFVAEGVPEAKIWCIPSGLPVTQFSASEAAALARAERIRSGARLRVLFVGAFSLRKGALDFCAVSRALSPQCEFRVVGPVTRDAQHLTRLLKGSVDFVGKVPQHQLERHYEWGDVFFFPSLEEGLATVLGQARASGLPIIATEESGATEILAEGEGGFIVPARNPDASIDVLRSCLADRGRLMAMLSAAGSTQHNRTWADAANEFAERIASALADASGS